MKQGSTLFLKGIVLAIGLTVLVLSMMTVPIALSEETVGGYRPILFGMYVTTVPFFIAIYQALRLLGYIDRNKAFSDISVQALTNIKYAALIVGGLYAAGMPYIFHVADKDDAPGVVAIAFIFIFASIVIATIAAVLQRVLQSAIDIKSENDLTV